MRQSSFVAGCQQWAKFVILYSFYVLIFSFAFRPGLLLCSLIAFGCICFTACKSNFYWDYKITLWFWHGFHTQAIAAYGLISWLGELCMSISKLECCQLYGEFIPPLSVPFNLRSHFKWKHPNGLLGDWRQQQEGKSRAFFNNKSTLFGPEFTCRCVPQTCWGQRGVNGTTQRVLCPWVLIRDDMAKVPNSTAKWEQAENDPTLPKWPFSKRL